MARFFVLDIFIWNNCFIKSFKSGYYINNAVYTSEKTKISLDKIKLSKKLQIEDILKIEVKTFFNGLKNNDFVVRKLDKKNIIIQGELFDAEPLLKTLYKTDDKKVLSKNFTYDIKINLDKATTGTKFVMVINIPVWLM